MTPKMYTQGRGPKQDKTIQRPNNRQTQAIKRQPNPIKASKSQKQNETIF
jgi:hypothetical protein